MAAFAPAQAQCPSIVSIMVDACGTEQDNEFIIINSGTSGFNVSSLEIDYDINNNIIGPENNDINVGPMSCGIQAGNTAMVTGCTNVIAADPAGSIPPNSYVIFQTSAATNTTYNFSAVCGSQQCIYVLQSTCFRSAGAFSNGGSGTRTTTLSINGSCVSSYTYDRASLVGGNGAYYLPPNAYGNGGCTAPPGSFGNPPTMPMLSGVPATICQSDPAIVLPTPQSGINGNWSGTGVSGNTFNPSGLSGSITLTFTPSPGQCSAPATTSIMVNTGAPPLISGIPASICQNDPAIFLNTNQSGVSGIWSGMGVSGNMFNPAGLSGSITLTFTPDAGQCSAVATANITVNPANSPVISGVPATICQIDPAIILPTNQGGITGNWSGTGVSGNMFNPTGLNGSVTLTFTPTAGQCANTATTSITVDPLATPVISGVPNSICQSDPAIVLPTNQGGITGNWSGLGVSGNMFNPNGLIGNITLTFTPTAGQCASVATTSINVTLPAIPVISGIPNSICESDPAIVLPTNQGGISGTWSGLGVSGNQFNPSGLNGNITLTFTPTAGQCASVTNFIISVDPPMPPILIGVPASVCQDDPAVPLPTNQGGVLGNWSGVGVFGNTFDPTGQSGNINLTFTPNPGQCAAPASTSIFVSSGNAPVITGVPTSICETDPPIALPTTQSGVFGSWSGPGVAGNSFNPAGITGNVTLTFTPNSGQCASPATTEITVEEAQLPTISGIPNSLCESDPAIALPTNQGGVNGTWSGMGVSGNTFDPTGLSGNVVLVFNPNPGLCASVATANITVNTAADPNLSTATLCENDPPINLSTLADPLYPAGSWSGMGVSGSTFNPAGLSGNITLTFTPATACVNVATTTITINELAVPQLGTDAICQNNGLYDLTQLNDPLWPNGTWSGPGVSGNSFNPAGQNGMVNLTFTPSADCTSPATTTISIQTSPNFSGLMEDCDPATQTYTVSFNITGGDPATYTVDGTPVGGSLFTSLPIASGVAYSFQLDDGNGCGPVMVNGVENCACVTNSGTMDLTGSPFMICPSVSFSLSFNNNQNLDPDDVLIFVMHDNAGASLGNILAISNTTSFPPNIPGIVLGQTYYVSAVAGSDNGNGTPDPDDACLSVSQGVPIVFYIPSVALSPSSSICNDECIDIALDFNGQAPFDIDWGLLSPGIPISDPIFGITEDTVITVCPQDFNFNSGVINFTIYTLLDSICINDFAPDISTSITVIAPSNFNYNPTFCAGEEVVINGTIYGEANPTGTEIFVGGNYLGCDSIVSVNLSFYPPAIFDLNETLCPGGSVTVNGTVYNEANPSGTEILQNASINGCDSTVNVNLSFNSVVVGNFAPTLCPGTSIIINGNTYDESNPSGTENFPMGSYLGCDSTLNVNLSFYPMAVFDLDEMLCTGGSLTVNGTVYNEANPSGTEVLPLASVNGCDSIINVSLTFASQVVNDMDSTLCPGGVIIVNGTIYSESTPSGSEIFVQGSYLGCDSIVNVNLSFYPPAVFDLEQTLCTGGSLIVNGTEYNEANPSGTEILQNASVNGCDSIVNVNLNFNSVVVSDLNDTLCPGDFITVNGHVYDEITPNGSETFPMGSYLGCDSTVNINLSFFPTSEFDLIQTLCTGGSITVNGTEYNEANPSGTEILDNASVNGCDSIVHISLTFDQAVVTNINSTLCSGDSIVVNGNTYDESSPSGAEFFPMGSYLGCDSTVFVDLSFYPPAVFNLVQTLCADDSVTVNGTVYNQGNPSGTEVFQNANGCDTTVNVNLGFYAPAVAVIDDQLCTGGSITVNGTVYDESNPSGTEILANIALHGCDSTVIIDLTFGNEVIVSYDPILCPGESIVINGTIYFIGNTTGTETFPDASYLGCDSTMNVSLSFYPEAIFTFDTILQIGQSIVVNGTVYDQSNLNGTEVIGGGSSTGCDSIIFVSLTIEGLTEAEVESQSPTCKGGSDGFISIEGLTGGTPPYTFALNGTNSMQVDTDDFPVVYNGLPIGFYTITIVDAANKITTVEVFLPDPPELVIDLGPDQTIQLGESANLNAITPFPVIDYVWTPVDFLDCIDCPDPQVVLPGQDMEYLLTVTNEQGCTASEQVSIFVEKTYTIYAPNAFSPNNDAINDEFTIFSGPQARVVRSFLIFDRWGNMVHEFYNMPLNDLSIGWDGKFKGKALDPAVFVWFAEVEFVDGHVEMFEGGVTLVR